MIARDESRPERAHYAGDVGANDYRPRYLFEGAKHRLIVEGAALNDDVVAELLRVRQFYDLVKSVLYDRISESRGNVGYLRALFLRLLHV